MSTNSEIVLAPGQILYREGDPNDCAYIIESGEIVVHSMVAGERIYHERRGPGSIVGELSLLMKQPRAVTVEAVTDCRLYQISAGQIMNRFERLDPVLRACIETSINFAGTLTDRGSSSSDYVPLAPCTVRNAADMIELFRIEADIVTGLERQEFSLVYQPIVRLEDGGIVGVEALMRWNHPTLGVVPPFRFIEVAEAMGSIAKLTNFALIDACRALAQMKRAPSAPPGLFASVNISGKDIGRTGFVDFVAQTLDLNGLDASALKLEVTETSLVNDPQAAAEHLEQLRNLGCGISIDDFGTGYSNLAYLKKLPLDTLKIDRAFAGDAHADSVSRGIVRMLIGLGSELGVDIVAEGLETIHDVETLLSLGCKYAQGYYFSRPVPEAEILVMLGADETAVHAA